MNIELHEGDSREVLRGMIERGEFVHSVVTDPPYGLVSVVKRFGKEGAAPAKRGTDGAFARQSRGFMGKAWDGTAIERDPEFWKLVYDVMLPGAYIVAFSSSRTYHHMAIAMEQAGFVTHPMIGWTFASGFPKAHNAARAVDQALGVEGGVGQIKPGHGEFAGRATKGHIDFKDATEGFDRPWMKDDEARERYHMSYAPGSPEAAEWEGWHYGAQVRKPALEPIYVGQKPFGEKNGALNILKHGVGAVNIDGCRVDTREESLGRWPANLIHDGSPEVVALFPDSKGAQAPVKGTEPSDGTADIYGKFNRVNGEHTFRGDTEGSAARFFECYPFEGKPVFHFPKANKRDRAGSKHPTVKPIALIRSLIRHVTPPGCRTLDPFAGSGTAGQAAREEGVGAVLIEMEAEYAADIRRRLNLPSPCADLDDLLDLPSPCADLDDLLDDLTIKSTVSGLNELDEMLS